MPEKLIVRHCAPTLAGIKTGNLFTCPAACARELMQDVRRVNRMLVPRGLRVLPLRLCNGRALIYVYRPQRLQRDMAAPQARGLLRRFGYPCGDATRCVRHLIGRLRDAPGFPHEIGLFLGYPPEDVQGFLEQRACKCCGCWKVYGDAARACALFEQYRKCTRIYCRLWAEGRAITQLAVAAR